MRSSNKSGRPNIFSKFWKIITKLYFFGKAHEVRSTRTLVVQTCTENVRLPTSMQALIWFPEVFRIALTFERLWESQQKRLKNALTVDNYSRKKKRDAWRSRGTFDFLMLFFFKVGCLETFDFILKQKISC